MVLIKNYMTAHPALLSRKLADHWAGLSRECQIPPVQCMSQILKTFNVYSGRAMLGL